MKTRAMLWAGLLLLGSAAWAQPESQEPGGKRQFAGKLGPEATLNEAQEGELLAFIKANEPMMAEHLGRAKSEEPSMYHHKLAELWQMYKDPDVRQQFSKTMKANRASRELVEQYKKAEGADKAALKDKLTGAVGDQFDVDVAGKELQIKKMTTEIAKLKDKIGKRREQKDKYVAKRVEQMTSEGGDWEW
ncbi:MAG: hypothetical protein HY077_11010 [Elusimicrobia bacterium]|nr:hypothetical protein [Elusimicrobiota bacterium]